MRRLVLIAVLFAAAAGVGATTRAELRSTHVDRGQPVVLTITTDALQAPDYGPLGAGFVIDDVSVERSFSVDNGGVALQQRYVLTLTPRGSGTVIVPALAVGNDRTQPLALEVGPIGSAPASPGLRGSMASGRGPVFVQATVDDAHPYVQQTVGMTVRLYYATQLVSGQLDVPAPDGASLVQVGEDSRGLQQVGGRNYGVIERHYQVIPERSGMVTLPAPRFNGAGEGGLLDQVFGDGREDLRASGQPVVLQVRSIPPAAPQPWLPLHSLALRMSGGATRVRAGETVVVTLQLQADGATAAQLPALALDAGPGSQVFPEAPQVREGDRQGRPQATVTRRFSVLPGPAGTLRVHAAPIAWWNVDAARAETAATPDLVIQVAPGAGQAAVSPPSTGATGMGPRTTGGNARPLAMVLLGGAVLVVLALAWRARRPEAAVASVPEEEHPTAPPLKDALAGGHPSTIADALQREAGVNGLDAVGARLADPVQADAVARLQRTLWRGGDVEDTVRRLRAGFRAGPSWREAPTRTAAETLPPLYPED